MKDQQFLLNRRRLLKLLGAASASALLPGCGSSSGVDIPPPVRGDARRVIIVGAGMAGLTAANALNNAGVECVVLEARDRIGGRLWTRDVGGIPIDMGGSWIHEPDGNPMSEFARRAGVARRPVDPTNDLLSIYLYEAESGPALQPEAVLAFAHYQGFEETAGTWLQQLGPGASVKDGILRYLSVIGATMLPEQRRRAEHLTRFVNETFDAAHWEDISLYYHVNSPVDTYGGSEFGDFPVGGYRRLVKAMTSDSEIRLQHRVTRIAASDGGVAVDAVATDNGGESVQTITGSHVLVTLPLGVLKRGPVAFEPDLPQRKQAAIQKVGFGHFEKVAMRFDEPFWESGVTPRTHFYFRSDSQQLPMEFPFWLDLQHSMGELALVGLTSAAFAQDFVTRSEEQIRSRVMEIFRAAYGASIPQPTNFAITSWGVDEFAAGAYSYLAVGSAPEDMDALAEPVAGRILFAGEATYAKRYGYADGALSSGLREVRRLLQTNTVEITPGPT